MRLEPKIVLRQNSPNKSSRNGVEPRAIILHSTESHNREGRSDLEGVASWLCNPAAQASAHVIVDGDGTSARLVHDQDKAWHCAHYNSQTLGIEQIGFASYGRLNWLKERRELKEAARWIAHWSKKYHIPIQKAHVSGGTVTTPGVTTHKALGSLGGGHWDPGEYPFSKVLRWARRIKRRL